MDTKRFSLRKSLLSLLVAVLLTFTLVACGDKDADLVEEALDSLAIVFASGDDADNVTRNLNLPTTVGDVTITWSSSNPSVVSNAGVVTRQFSDVTVTLTATAVLNDATDTATFEVKVIRINVQAALDAIALTGDNISYSTTTEKYTVVGNITLPTTSNGVTVAWESSIPAVLSNAGAVTRPAYGENDANILLIATINNVEREFEIVVPAITEKPASLILQEASDQLLLAGTSNGVSQNLSLPSVVGTEGVTVTWTSDTPAVISNAGVVVRTENNVTVVLTATLHYGTETLEKEFEVVVLAAENFELAENIADAISMSKDGLSAVRTYVKINAVTIMGITNDGVVFADDSGFLFAYMGSRRDDLEVGGVYDVIGLTDRYFGSWQLNNTAVSATPVIWIESDAEATVVTPVVAESVTDMMANHIIPTTEAPDIEYVYYRLTAKVRVQNPGDNYGTVFVDSDYDGPDIPTAANSAHATDGVMIYYQSNKAAFDAFDGITVTFNALFYGYRSDRTVFTILFIETVDDIENTLSDVELVDVAENALRSSFDSEYIEATTLTLPSTLLGATITYTSSNEAIINSETGVVTLPAEGQVEVTLTATIILNDVEKAVEIVILVGELQILSVSEALALPADSKVRVVGVVTGFVANNTFAIQDETGAIAVFVFNTTNRDIWIPYIGKTVDLIGTRTSFNGLQQIGFISAVPGDATPLPLPTNIDGVPLTATDLLPYQAQHVTRANLVVDALPAQSFGNVLAVLKDPGTEETIELFWDSRIVVAGGNIGELQVGDVISVIGVPLTWTNNLPRFAYTRASQIYMGIYVDTDEGRAEAVAGLLVIPEEIESATTLTLPTTGSFDATIVWESTNNAVINDETGVVTLPTEGNVTVTLTATVTVGDAEYEKVFTIVVGEIIRDIAVAREMATGTIVTVEGTITAVQFDSSDRGVVFMQDDTAGIYVYKVPATMKDDLVVGNTIKIRAALGYFASAQLVQLVADFVSLEVTATDVVVAPVVLTDPAEQINVQSQLVSITGYLRQLYAGTPSDYHLVTEMGTFALRLASGSDAIATDRDDIIAKLVGVAAGTEVTVVAGMSRFGTTMQTMLFHENQITIGALGSDEDLGAVALAHVVLPEADNEVVADLTLPTTGLFGTTFTWSSNSTDVITDAGVVTRPEYPAEDAVVIMSYEFKIGETVLDFGDIEFTVLATEEVVVDGPVTVVAAYPGGSTTNMTAGNNATTIGLDETIFTVTSTERVGSPLHVGLNTAGQIRLYGSSDTEGNILTIAITAGYKITNIEFVFGSVVGNALIMAGGTEQFNGALTANGTLTYTGLDVTNFSIQNKNAGTGQIYILSISITFEAVE